MTHNKEKNQLINIDLEMMQIIKLMHNNIKTTVFHIFKKPDEGLCILRCGMEDFKKITK